MEKRKVEGGAKLGCAAAGLDGPKFILVLTLSDVDLPKEASDSMEFAIVVSLGA